MPSLLTAHPLALRILMDEDIYLTEEPILIEKAPEISAMVAVTEIPVVETVIVPEKEIPVSYNYLGENNKYMLVLLKEEGYEFCSPKTLEALTNMLKGKQMEIKDIALLNLAKHTRIDFRSLKAYFACSKLVLFGINPATIGLAEITSNKITLQEGVKLIATYSFAEMQDDTAKKRTFWHEMKLL